MYRFNKFWISTALYLLFFLFSASSCAQSASTKGDISGNDCNERIINFHSDITIDITGKIEFIEHITAYAGGLQIKHGLQRQLPLYRKDINGNSVKIEMKLRSVLCNGVETKYHTETGNNNLNVYIGDENTLLSPGIYDYTITYDNYGQVGFFDTFDELYWNVTGNGWNIDIEKASASITLPGKASSIKTACYTGALGSSQMDCYTDVSAGNVVTFTTNHALKPKEGLTVSVSFPRDIIKRPSPPTYAETQWNKYKRYICAGIGLLLFGFYFFFTWKKVGKDPAKPVVIPQFKPPHNWSPATVRYLYKKRFDDKVFTVSLINMAVNRAISIFNKDKTYTLNAIEKKETLAHEEVKVYETLFSSKQSIEVKDSNHTFFSKASSNLLKCLKKSSKLSNYIRRNLLQAFGGFLLIFLILILYGIITNPVTVIDYLVMIGLILLLLVLYIIYVNLIKAFTPLGAQTQSELEGLKMYLKTAEENRWNTLMPPEKTPDLFEKLLPYAIALDVGNEWCKKFDNTLKLANYNPDWYTGNQPFTPILFGSVLANSFGSSLSSAKINPTTQSSGSRSWSSGSGGGGFVGGGGGGGGGGGW